MSDIDVLSKLPDETIVAAASVFPDPATATETFQRVILKLPDGKRAEVTFARLPEKKGRSFAWRWVPAGAVLLE
jgi:hypothetical protein